MRRGRGPARKSAGLRSRLVFPLGMKEASRHSSGALRLFCSSGGLAGFTAGGAYALSAPVLPRVMDPGTRMWSSSSSQRGAPGPQDGEKGAAAGAHNKPLLTTPEFMSTRGLSGPQRVWGQGLWQRTKSLPHPGLWEAEGLDMDFNHPVAKTPESFRQVHPGLGAGRTGEGLEVPPPPHLAPCTPSGFQRSCILYNKPQRYTVFP